MNVDPGTKSRPTDAEKHAQLLIRKSEVLGEAARCIEADLPWYETLGLHLNADSRGARGAHGVRGARGAISVTAFLDSEFDKASEIVVVPVLNLFKELFDAVGAAPNTCDESLELSRYCVVTLRCLLKAACGREMPPKMAMTFGELKSEMEDVRAFVLTYDSRTTFCRKTSLNIRDSATAAKLKRKLDGLLDTALGGFSFPVGSVGANVKAKSLQPRHKLTFVSHAGEDKEFVRDLLKAIEQANVAAFFDDDMALGTTSINEMESRAAEADQAIIVISRPFLSKEWPMRELNIFLENDVSIHPLFYGVTPDEISDIVAVYDRIAGGDDNTARLKMKNNPCEWKRLMEEVGGPTRFKASTSLPDPLLWRRDAMELGKKTGLRFDDFQGDKLSYIETIARIVSPPRLPDALPSLPHYYVKPPLVDEVIQALIHTTPTTVSHGLVLTGLAGAGKSVIATACARDKTVRRYFRDGILWLNDEPDGFSEQRFLDQLNSLAKQFREVVLVRHYRQGPRDKQTSQAADKEFKDLRAAQEYFIMYQKKFELRCLLIVDDAWNMQILEAVRLIGFQILATTRNKDVTPTRSGWHSLIIPEMEADASLLVLSKCSGATSSVPMQPALQVAKDCAFLPQALAIVGSMPLVADAPHSADAWRELHENLKAKAELKEHDDGHQQSIESALGVSFDGLGREQRGRFLKLAVLAKGTAASNSMLSHLWEQDLADCRVAVKDLVNRSLVQGQNDKYVMHDRVLDLVKRKIEEEEALKKVAILRQSEYLGGLNVIRSYIDEDVSSGVYSLTALWRSVESLSGDRMLEVNTYKARLDEREITSGAEMDMVEELNAVARFFDIQGKLDEAEPLYRRIQSIVGKTLGDEDPMYAATLNNRAGLYDSQGKYQEAGELYGQAIEIGEKTLSDDDPVLAQWLSNRAVLLQTQGKFDQAMPLFDRSLAIREKVLGRDHPHVASTLNGKAYLLTEMGFYTEAKELMKRSIEIAEEALGPSSPNLAYVINNLGVLMVMQGNLDEAYDLYVRATDIFEETLGPLHENVATLLNNRACLLQELGRYEEAESLIARVIEIGESNLGLDHTVMAARLNNQAASMVHLGKYSAAEALQTRIPTILEKALGPEHPLVATSLSNQAVVLEKQGRHAEADSVSLRALKMRENVLGPDHPDLAISLNNRALLLEKQGRIEEADQLYVRALEINEMSVGPDHRGVGTIFHNRAAVLEKQGKIAEADVLYERAVGILERALGPQHVQVATALSSWAELLRTQGEFDKADPLFVRAIEIARKSGSTDHETLASTLNNRAWLLKATERFAEAESMLMEAMEIWKEALGPRHHHVATALNNIGELLRAQDKSVEAESFYRRALAIDEEEYGSSHQAVAIDLNNLAMALGEQGKYHEADDLYRRVVAIDEEAYGPDHPEVAADLTNWAVMLTWENKHDRAIPLLERALAIQAKELGERHEHTKALALMLEDIRTEDEQVVS